MTESTNAGIARAIIQAVSDFDFATVHDLVAEDVLVEQGYPALGQPEQYRGKEAFIAGLKLVPTLFSEFQLTIKALYECPDQNLVIFEQTSRGVFLLNGEVYQNDYVMFFWFEDGLVRRWKEYYNPEVMARDMGAVLAQMSASA